MLNDSLFCVCNNEKTQLQLFLHINPCRLMRCWNWQTTSRGPMALPLGSKGSCNALTTESPLCKQDRPMAAGQSPPGSSSCKTKAQKSSIGMGRSCCVKKAASLGEQKTAENYFKCFTTARALWKLYLLLLEWKTYFVAPKIFEHNFLYCSQLPLMLARGILKKFCRRFWTSPMTAAERLN